MSDFFIISSNSLMSSKEICQFFGIPESTLRHWEKTNKIKSQKVDGLKKYNVSEVDIEFRNSSIERKTFFPDWFYYIYESPDCRRKIETLEDYYNEYPSVKGLLEEAENHSWSVDSLSNYEFSRIERGDSPLAHHKIVFKPKENHPMKRSDWTISELTFEVFFDTIDAKPIGEKDSKNQFFAIEYNRIVPHFVRFVSVAGSK